jgi:hypothetical protein
MSNLAVDGPNHNTAAAADGSALCLACKARPLAYESSVCHHALYCRQCAMKCATGGKCKVCGKMFPDLKKIFVPPPRPPPKAAAKLSLIDQILADDSDDTTTSGGSGSDDGGDNLPPQRDEEEVPVARMPDYAEVSAKVAKLLDDCDDAPDDCDDDGIDVPLPSS